MCRIGRPNVTYCTDIILILFDNWQTAIIITILIGNIKYKTIMGTYYRYSEILTRGRQPFSIPLLIPK